LHRSCTELLQSRPAQKSNFRPLCSGKLGLPPQRPLRYAPASCKVAPVCCPKRVIHIHKTAETSHSLRSVPSATSPIIGKNLVYVTDGTDIDLFVPSALVEVPRGHQVACHLYEPC